MRTLKKTLALVLVIAMCLSIGVIGANAAFTDTATNDYNEAIQVMNGIGVINGMTATTFAPDGTLTREQAAKIIAYMLLGPTNAKLISNATTSKFSDVATTRWSAGYIEYCANLGIINGVGDGKFAPEGTLTTAAFTKLLLCALGYKADVEGFTGASWAINVAALAVTAGVYDEDIAISATANITRAQACQLALLTLQADMVKYSGGSTMTVGGVTITTGATREDAETTFMGKYFPTLDTEDDTVNGLNGFYWVKGTTTISDFVVTDAVLGTIHTLAVAGGTLYTNYKWDADVDVYYNNDLEASGVVPADIDIVKGETALVSDSTGYTFNGADINLVDTDSNGKVDKIAVVATYLGTVTKVTAAKGTAAAYLTLTVYDTPDTDRTVTVTEDNYDISGFVKGDYVLIVPSSNTSAGFTTPTYMAVADSVNAKVTAYNTTKGTFVVDGTTYTYSDNATMAEDINSLKTTYTFYFDKNGTVIGSKVYSAAATALNYAYLVAVDSKAASSSLLTSSAAAMKVKLTYMDGTSEVLDYVIKTVASTTDAAYNAGANRLVGDSYITFTAADGTTSYAEVDSDMTDVLPLKAVYAYTKNSDGAVTLSKDVTYTVNTVDTTATALTTDTDDITFNKGVASVDVNGTTKYASSSTKLVLLKSGAVTTYTGYASIPSNTYTVGSDVTAIVYVTTGNVITNVLVVGGSYSVTTFDAYGVYLGAGDVTSDGAYYNFFVNGEVKSYLLSDDNAITLDAEDEGTVYAIDLDSDGAAILTGDVSETATISMVGDGYIVTDAGVVYTASDMAVYDITDDSAAYWTEGTLDENYTITYVTEENASDVSEIVVAFITAVDVA